MSMSNGIDNSSARLSPLDRSIAAVKSQVALQKKTAVAAPVSNPLYSVMTDKALSQQEKTEQIAKLLASDMSKEANREKLAWIQQIQERLSNSETNLNEKVIEFLDSGTFSELQACWGEIGNDLNHLQDEAKPFMDKLQALFNLRTSGQVFDALREIEEDQKFEETNNKAITEAETDLAAAEESAKTLMNEIAVLGEERSMFGFGGVKSAARQAIATKTLQLKETSSKIEDLKKKVQDLKAAVETRKANSKFSQDKADFRALLTDPEHVEKQKKLISNTLAFIKKTKERTTSVRGRLDNASNSLSDANDVFVQLTQAYAVLDSGLAKASDINKNKRTEFDPKDNEDEVSKIERESNLRELDNYTASIEAAAASTGKAKSNLSENGVRINNMQTNISQQITTNRELSTTGVAKMTGQLSNMFMALNAGALNEASLAIHQTLGRVDEISRDILKQDAIRMVTNAQESVAETEKQIKSLLDSREALEGATSMLHDITAVSKENLEKLREESIRTIEAINESSKVRAGVGVESAKTPKPNVTNNNSAF